MSDVKRVRAVEKGFGSLQPGAPHQRIRAGTIFTVPASAKASWFVDYDVAPEPAKAAPRGPRKKPDEPASDAEPLATSE